MFFSCSPFVVNTTFSTGLVGLENVVSTTGKKHTNVGWDDGGKIGKIIN